MKGIALSQLVYTCLLAATVLLFVPYGAAAKPAGGVPPDRGAVLAYLKSLDDIGPTKPASDLRFWRSIFDMVKENDVGGLDKVEQQLLQRDQRIKALNAPPPCVELHKYVISLSMETRGLPNTIREAVKLSDVREKQLRVSKAADFLRVRVREVEMSEIEVKRRYGLIPWPPVPLAP